MKSTTMILKAVIEFLKNTGTSSSVTYAFLDNLTKSESNTSDETKDKESKNEIIMNCLKVLVAHIRNKDANKILDVPVSNNLDHDEIQHDDDGDVIMDPGSNDRKRKSKSKRSKEKKQKINEQEVDQASSSTTNEESSLFSSQDICSLIIPWVVKRICTTPLEKISKEESNYLLWEALDLSLDGIIVDSDTSGNDNEITQQHDIKSDGSASLNQFIYMTLNQSSLHKIIHVAAQVALSSKSGMSKDESLSSISLNAANVFSRLITFYTPTFDNALKIVLDIDRILLSYYKWDQNSLSVGRIIEDIHPLLELPIDQMKVVLNSLHLVHRRLLNSNTIETNVKRLCSKEVLIALARLSLVQTQTKQVEDKDGGISSTTNSSCLDHVQKILWGCLYNFQALDINDYRKVLIPSIVLNSNKKGVSIPKLIKNKKNSPFTYRLFYILQDIYENFFATQFMSKDKNKVHSTSDMLATSQLLPLLFNGFVHESTVWDQESRHSSKHHYTLKEKLKKRDDTTPTSPKIILLQFRFWALTIQPICEGIVKCAATEELSKDFKKDYQRVILSLFQCLSNTLSTIINDDVYLPSYEDKEQINYLVLASVTKKIVEWVDNKSKEVDLAQSSSIDYSQLPEKITSQIIILFHQLLDMNHYLLHDHLSTIIPFVIRFLHSNTTNVIPSQFLSSLIATYSKLRQLDHFLVCILHVLEIHSSIFDVVWNDRSVIDSLVSGVKNLPSGQVTVIWKSFDDWIVTQANSIAMTMHDDNDDNNQLINKEGCLQFGIRIFVLFIQSLHVDKSIATTLQTLCEESMSSSIHSLLTSILKGKYESKHDITSESITSCAVKQGLLLLRHLIDLYSQCHFWLNPIRLSNDAMSSFLLTSSTITKEKKGKAILDFLRAVCRQWRQNFSNSSDIKRLNKGLFHANKIQNILEEVQYLAIYKIQHLQSMIFLEEEQAIRNKLLKLSSDSFQDEIEQQQNAMNLDAKEKLGKEMQEFLDFCFTLAINRGDYRRESSNSGEHFKSDSSFFNGWDVICKHLPLLAQLTVNPDHIAKFLTWMFSILAIDDKEYSESSPTNINVSTFPLDEKMPINQFLMEQHLATSLLQEDSFYEVNQVADQIINVAVGCVISLIKMAFVPSKDSRDCWWEENMTWNGVCILSSQTSWCSNSLLDDENLKQILKAYEEDNKMLSVITGTVTQDRFNDAHCQIFLNRASRLLKIMNGMPKEYISIEDKNRRVHVLLRVDILLQSFMIYSVNVASSETMTVMSMLLSTCRSIIANDLSSFDVKAISFITGDFVKSFLHLLFRSTAVLLQINNSLQKNREQISLILQQSTNQIVYEITKQSINAVISSSKGEHSILSLSNLVDFLIQIVENSSTSLEPDKIDEDLSFRFRISFVRTAMDCLMANLNEGQFHRLLKKSSNSNIEQAFTNLKSFIWLNWFSTFEPPNLNEQQLAEKYFHEKLLLLCDMLIYWKYTKEKNLEQDNESSIMASIINTFFYALSDRLLLQQEGMNTDSHISPRMKSASITFFSTLFVQNLWDFVVADNNNCMEENMVKLTCYFQSFAECKSIPKDAQNSTIDTVFCQMISQITSDSKKDSSDYPRINKVMKFLLRELKQHIMIDFHDESNNDKKLLLPSLVHAFYLLLNSIRKHPTTELSNMFREFYFVSLNLLAVHPKQLLNDNSYSTFISPCLYVISASIFTTSGKRDIIALTNREASTAFSQISAIFVPNNDNVICSKIFCQCCAILSSFLNHNHSRSQRIHSTIPSFVFLVKSILLHLLRIRVSSVSTTTSLSLKTATSSSMKSSSLKLRDFSSLCESMIPYRDILKKHIIGLLICFSDFLSRMDPFVKKEIMPAIFSLLDICGSGSSNSYEIQELNSRMKNPTSKSLFKSVFQSYNKFHKFKGQC